MRLVIPVHDSNKFSWDPKDQTFATEASTLVSRGQGFLGRIYDDACDIGFDIKSVRTGEKKLFYLAETHKDAEGDVTHWTFVSRSNAFKAIVFND